MSYICLANTCSIAVNCPGEVLSIQYLQKEFQLHWTGLSLNLPIVGEVLLEEDIRIPASAVLLCSNRLYAKDGVVFCKDGNSILALELEESLFQIRVNRSTSGILLALVLQTLLNWYIPRYGLVFLHTSSFRFNEKVYAIHGFGGAGKTETMIEALQRGAQYLSDDLAIFDQEGFIHPYYRRIGLHDYSFTDEQLTKLHIDKKKYGLMKMCEKRNDRISRYIFQRLRGHFKISVSPEQLYSFSTSISVIDRLKVDLHYWLDLSDETCIAEISNESFIQRMTFCMQNEFRSFVDFDGYFGFLYEFWGTKRLEHDALLQKVVSSIDIIGLRIKGQNYNELARLILE